MFSASVSTIPGIPTGKPRLDLIGVSETSKPNSGEEMFTTYYGFCSFVLFKCLYMSSYELAGLAQ